MTKKHDEQESDTKLGSYIAIGAGIGVAVGAGIGVAIGNIGLGASIGVAIGPAVGATFALARQKNLNQANDD